MVDPTKLIKQLSEAWQVSEDVQNTLYSESATRRNDLHDQLGLVGISTVSTFIAKKNFQNFAVPSFATHWGVVIDFNDPPERILYHILFEPECREVVFSQTSWMSKWSKHNVIPVGTTLYGMAEVYRIGNHILLCR